MHPGHAVANIADTRSTEGKAPNKHLNSDLDAACAQPRSFWAGLVGRSAELVAGTGREAPSEAFDRAP